MSPARCAPGADRCRPLAALPAAARRPRQSDIGHRGTTPMPAVTVSACSSTASMLSPITRRSTPVCDRSRSPVSSASGWGTS
ncbi:hypothetical protein KTR9_0750 [Gordonia sp. KTR9]|nr:hypothetical protein KTR9_0750 [Gordonia sp. KTR9]